jgi:hypothetical protein
MALAWGSGGGEGWGGGIGKTGGAASIKIDGKRVPLTPEGVRKATQAKRAVRARRERPEGT